MVRELDFHAIGSRIKERRQGQGVTQEFIANRLDVNPSHISNIECGRAKPSLTALVRIADTLDCSVDYFLEGEYGQSAQQASNLDSRILDKLRFCSSDKKERVLKMIDLL